MFAPPGYRDIYGIIRDLKMQIDFETDLHFPSLEEVPVEQLAYLAWLYGELDFLEEVVFEIALEVGLFLASPDGQLMRVSMNPVRFSDASAIDLLDENNLAVGMREQLNLTVPANKDFDWEEGQDPWAAHRALSHRRWPMVFSRSDYRVGFDNHEVYIRSLTAAGYKSLVELTLDGMRRPASWEVFSGHSFCVEESSIAHFESEKVVLKIQNEIFSAVWENAEEVFEEYLQTRGKSRSVVGKVNLETKAIAVGRELLAEPDYEFRTLAQLRTDLGIPLGERAWRRVVEALRSRFPHISTPGRKS